MAALSNSHASVSRLATRCEQFFASLCDPAAGAALLEMHAGDALVRQPQGLGAARDIGREAFAHQHADISVRGREWLPRFTAPVLLEVTSGTPPSATVVWVKLDESRIQKPLIAAMGLRYIDDEWRVGWCTLAPRVLAWSYAEGLLQSLADYPWMRRDQPTRARALVDATYFRLHSHEPVKFRTLPDARFSCQMSTVCCRHDFEIALPPEAQLLIDAMPWATVRPELAGTRLGARADGKLLLKSLNETCRFLGEQRQCLIHQTIGRQPFGPCAVFPIAFASTPDGVAVALSPICGTVRRGLGLDLREREADLRERLVQAEPRITDTYRLAPGVAISWQQFRDIEQGLCDTLAADDLSLRQRLYVGIRLLGALAANAPVDVTQWLAEPRVTLTPELRQALGEMLLRILDWDRATLRSIPRSIPPQLSQLESREPTPLSLILRNTLFAKTYSYPFDLTTAYNLGIVLYLLALLMEAARSEPLSDAMWRELGSLGVHGLLKSVLHDGVPEAFRKLFGTAELGQWLLVL